MTGSARQIENLLYAYATHIDAGDLDGVAALFTHGRIQAVPEAPPEALFEGHEAVRGMYEAAVKIYDDGTPKTKHTTTNAVIDVDEAAGRASSQAYYHVTQATDALPLQTIITGRYHDTFQRLDGQWWFDTRIMFVDQVGDLTHHMRYEI